MKEKKLHKEDLQRNLLKALQAGEITKEEAREIVDSGYSIPLDFWTGDSKIRPEAYKAVFGILPCIKWVGTNEEDSSLDKA